MSRRIAVSQRLDPVPGREEWRDAVDARWALLLSEFGLLPMPMANRVADPEAYVVAMAPEGVLLTGGNDLGEAPARDALETALLRYAEWTRVPVFGVCRGLQMINHYQGGRVVGVEEHVAVRHVVQGGWVNGLRDVNSYHNHGITVDDLGRDLEILATAMDGSIEAVRHVSLPWLGVMWHPEREPQLHDHDRTVLRELLM